MKRVPVAGFAVMAVGLLAGAGWLQLGGSGSIPASTAVGQTAHHGITLWDPLRSPTYAMYEKIALVANVVVALAGLGYALMLVGQVLKAPQGTQRMQEIARAVREGANAYLLRQFRVVFVLI